MRTYNRKRYYALSEDRPILDYVRGRATDAATNIVGGAANAAANKVSGAFKGVKLPPVSVGITKETKQMIYKAVGGLAAAGIVIAAIARSNK